MWYVVTMVYTRRTPFPGEATVKMAFLRYGLVFLMLITKILCSHGGANTTREIGTTPLYSWSKTTIHTTEDHRRVIGDNSPCPSMCQCRFSSDNTIITIENCKRDPSEKLWSMFARRMYHEIYIIAAQLQNFDCWYLAEQPLLTTLGLNNNRIVKFECNLKYSPQLKHVDLTNNFLSGIPHALLPPSIDPGPFEVNLSKNIIKYVTCVGMTESRITRLDLSHNGIEFVPCNLSVFVNVEYLYLNDNPRLQLTPCTFSKLAGLRVLNLGYCALQKFPCSLYKMQNLLEVLLHHNQLTEVPDTLTNNSNIELLDMSNNAITTISCGLATMSSVKILDLSRNGIVRVSCNMSSMSSLMELDLSFNALETVSCNISCLPALMILNLNNNDMRNGDCNLSLPHLSELDLSYNSLTSVPCDLPSMPRLSSLGLTSNKLTNIPCGLLTMSRLQILKLSHNNLKSVQCTSVTALSLQEVYLSHNLLEVVPFRNTSFPGLITLDLSNNLIKDLPREYLQNFPSLDSFSIQHNGLTALHNASFYGVQQLTALYLDYNKISHIDLGAFDSQYLSKLSSLSLTHNNLHTVDSWPLLLMQNTPIHISLAGNKLSHFTNNAGVKNFSCLNCADGLINIEGNQVTHLTDIFHGWNINVDSDLEHCPVLFDVLDNPLDCDCEEYSLYQYIRHVRQAIVGAVCAEPPSLRGRNPVLVPLDLFICNITEKCPAGCLCTENPHYKNITVICDASYQDTELPKTLPNIPQDTYSYSLEICKSSLREVAFRSYLPKVSVADFSMNSITHVSLEALQALRKAAKVYLDNNQLHRLPDNISAIVLSPQTQVRLSKNLWVCDCEAFAMKKWIIVNYKSIQDQQQVTCHSPYKLMGRKLVDVDHATFCPEDIPMTMYMIIAVLAGTVTLSLGCLPLAWMIRLKFNVEVYQRKTWEPINWDEAADEGKEFDVFVSYSNEDEEYVGEYLIPELEARGFKVCFHRVHFLGGESIIDNICNCIAKSKKMLAFYSVNYTKSNFGMYEFTMAMELDAQNATNRLVTIIDTNLDIQNLQLTHSTYFRTNSYIIRDERRFWETLVYTLPTHQLGTAADPAQDN